MAERAERCGQCRFWSEIPQAGGERGNCHRYAPPARIFSDSESDEVVRSDIYARWPQTREEDWCGDFKQNAEVRE